MAPPVLICWTTFAKSLVEIVLHELRIIEELFTDIVNYTAKGIARVLAASRSQAASRA
jgi:hypothetical protein